MLLRLARLDPVSRSFPDGRHLGHRLRLQRACYPSKERLERFSPKKRRRHPPRRGLSPAPKALLLCSFLEIGPPGAPGTHRGAFQTAWSSAATLTPRRTPAAAERSAPKSPQTAGGAPPPPPAES